MNKSIISISATFLILALISSCQKTITIKQPPYTSKVSIQSMLEPDSVPVVYFNRTVPYFDKSITFAQLVIRNATVHINDGTNTDILQLDSVFNKLYCEYDYFYKGSLPVQLNKTYTLTIINGTDQYTATATTMNLSRPVIDSTSYISNFKDLNGEHEGVIVYFTDILSQTNYYRYEMDRYVDTATKKAETRIASPCLGKDSIAIQELGRSVYSDAGQDGQEIKIVIEPAYSHVAGTKGMIRMQVIDKNAYDFFDQLDKQKLSLANPFVEPVFLRDGQFGSSAIGYFSAMVRSNPVNFIYPE